MWKNIVYRDENIIVYIENIYFYLFNVDYRSNIYIYINLYIVIWVICIWIKLFKIWEIFEWNVLVVE